MKELELKIVKETVMGNEIIISTYGLLKVAINNTPQGGYTVEDMTTRLKLLDLVEEHKDTFTPPKDEKENSIPIMDIPREFFERRQTLKLEDSDFEKLKALIKLVKWGMVSRFIIETVKQFG